MDILPDQSALLVVGAKPPRNPKTPVVILPALTGGTAEAVAAELVEGMPGSRLIVLPAPTSTRDGVQWHFDAWHALADSERRSMRLITGPTASYFGAVVKRPHELIAIVDEPLTAVAGILARSKEAGKTLRALRRDPDIAPWYVAGVASPQSRALLAPWQDTSELPVRADGEDARRWFKRLVRLQKRLRLIPATDAKAVARVCDKLLRVTVTPPSPRGEDEVTSELEESTEVVVDAAWLDAQLYALATGETGGGADAPDDG